MYGTKSAADTLSAWLVSQNMRIADFGEGDAYMAIKELLAANERQIRADLIDPLCEDTTDQLRLAGDTSTLYFHEVDEFGRGRPQKTAAGANLGIPLRKFEASLQWTMQHMLIATVADMDKDVAALMNGDQLRVQYEILSAFFLSSNYTMVDETSRNPLSLPVKRLLNADGFPVPPTITGATFNPATHTHYVANATLTEAFALAAIATVVEHNARGRFVVEINQGSEAAWRAFTGFVPRVDPRIIVADNTTRAPEPLNVFNPYDRSIGYFGPAEVWIKPYVPSTSYFVVRDTTKKPLAFRHRDIAGYGEVQIMAETEAYPLRAKTWQREFGVSVVRRESMAVAYIGGASYVDPTLPEPV